RGTVTREYDIPAATLDFQEPKEQEIPVEIRKKELVQMILRANQRLRVKTETFEKYSFAAETINVPANGEATWNKNPDGTSPFADLYVDKLFVRNYGTDAAQLTITFRNTLAMPEMLTVVYTAIA